MYGLSRIYSISVRELKLANHLQSSKLKIGQLLVIPSSVDVPVRTRRKPAATSFEVPVPTQVPVIADGSEKAGLKDGDEPGEIAVRIADAPVKESLVESESLVNVPLRSQLVQVGLDFLGVPYRRRGMSERRGFDCSGFVKTLFDKFQIDLPRSARQQFELGEKVARAELAVGDLVFFSTRGKIPTHVGIYIGDNQFIHAALRARQVIISDLSQSWYQKRFVGARRISDLWKDGQKPPEARGN